MGSSEMDSYSSLAEFCARNTNPVTAAAVALLNSPVNEGKTILVVEGADDRRVYSRFFNPETVEIFPDGRCDMHREILSALNPLYFDRIAAIKDADFDRLNGKAPEFANLFLTDERDLENMILKDGVPSSVEAKFQNRCAAIVLDEIHRDIMMISYLRWMNDRLSLQLHFDALRLSGYYRPPYVVDIGQYIADLNAVSKNAKPLSVEELQHFCAESPVHEYSLLTRGHDLMECLFIRARNASKGNFPKRVFFTAIRDSYTADMFSKTMLCGSFRSFRKNMLVPALSA